MRWDDVAARLDQHHTAFTRDEASRLDWYHREVDSAYATSHRRVTGAVESLDQTLHRGPDRHHGHDLDHGISL
jgi:hypothetical protein